LNLLPEQKILVDSLNDRFEKSVWSGLTPENWSSFVTAAHRHRIAPLLYHKICSNGAASMFPDPVIHNLRTRYLGNAGQNTVLFYQLNELVALLNNQGIPVMLLKGAHLAEFVYEDIALRPMADLDILVKEEHLSQVVRTAFDAGFRFFFDKNPETEINSKDFDYGIAPEFRHFQLLKHPKTKCLLEIHCFIASEDSAFRIPAAELWQNARSAMFNNRPVSLLSPEDLIIHLCLHAAYDHLFDFGLSVLYDISASIKHYGEKLDWKEISRRSTRWRTHQCLQLCLYFTKKWLGAEIPDAVFEDFHISPMFDVAEERIFKNAAPAPLHLHYIKWRNLESRREKIRYIVNVLFPGREFMVNRYLEPRHARLLIGRYFYRFFQGIKGVYAIAKTIVTDRQYDTRLRQGDDDCRLREWLIKS
jgi:hypothetical protein